MISSTIHRFPIRLHVAMAVGLAMALGAAPARAVIEVNIARVGFPALGAGSVVRYGMWAPVTVDIDLNGEASFDGELRVGQYDADGDVSYDSIQVSLRSETGGTQRYRLYTLANTSRNEGRLLIELRDANKETVEVLCQGVPTLAPQPANEPEFIDHDAFIILSVSKQAIGRIRELMEDLDSARYERELIVGHMDPAQLPEHWLGLEAVDVVVWDDARPAELTPQQLDALALWVRQGGTLLVAAAQTAGQLRLAKDFYRILPVRLGEVSAVEDLPLLRRHLLDVDEDAAAYARPVSVVECTARPEARKIALARNTSSDLLTERRIGRGRVVFLGVALKDFMGGATGSAVAFFRKVLHLRFGDGTARTRVSFFGKVIGAVAFSRSAGRYLFLAALFSLGYMLLATLGTWWFLGRRAVRQHAWSAFALVGLGASLLSAVIVQAQQGLGDKLHQLSVVDVEAGKTWAFATTYFGLKTASDRRLDVWLPADPIGATQPGPTTCLLRAVPPSNDPSQVHSSFIDPQEYRVLPASAEIRNVRLRATLKQFEGRWDGIINGTVSGNLVVRKNPDAKAHRFDWRFSLDSYIVNSLGVDLLDCYLIHSVFDIDGPGGIHRDRGAEIYAYPIGDLPSDGQRVKIAARCYQADEGQNVFDRMKNRTLSVQQNIWSQALRSIMENVGMGKNAESFASLDETKYALLLASTIGEFNSVGAMSATARFLGAATWSRDRLRQLDLREQLESDSVFLFGFARDPGPVQLFTRESGRDYTAITPDAGFSQTMYRVRIPVSISGEKPSEQADPNLNAES